MSEISNLIVEGKMYFLSQRTLLEIDVNCADNFSMLDFHLMKIKTL